MNRPDVLIIGAGPAGLAAASACEEQGVETTVVERGPAAARRDRYDPVDIVAGVGGAGLFSDGKFSFHPSATRLWGLRPEPLLRGAYGWCATVLSAHGVAAPPFPGAPPPEDGGPMLGNNETFSLKSYPSFYMPLEARTALIGALSAQCAPSLRLQTAARRIALRPLSVSVVEGNTEEALLLEPRALIIASGRLGPLLLQRDLNRSQMTFRRLEVGVRIEQDSSAFFLRDGDVLDPKLVGRSSSGHEWRTFCCCRNGEIVETLAEGLRTVSGRANGSPTTRSSVGFHVRILDPQEAEPVWSDLRARLADASTPVTEPIDEFLRGARSGASAMSALLGPQLSNALADGLIALRSTLEPGQLQDAQLHGPAVEGVAAYPDVSPVDLRLAGCDAWVAGDATGLFRGLTAALVSGYFVGRQAAAMAVGAG